MTLLRDAVGDARFSFVAGKGGVGKTTIAGALALELADAGEATHLISTDPAHSVGDLFGQPLSGGPSRSACSPKLCLEEFEAAAAAAAWTARAAAPVTALVEAGTYLDGADVAGFTRLALPGADEMMAVLRLVDLADGDARVVVDTAPTGHTLRLLDAAATHAGLARALRAMADKAAAVASGLTRRSVRIAGESIIDELEAYVRTFRAVVLDGAAFVVATRADDVVVAETERLIAALGRRRLRVAATVSTGTAVQLDSPCIVVPRLPAVDGCTGLRAWLAAQRSCATGPARAPGAPPAAVKHTDGPAVPEAGRAAGPQTERPAMPWLEAVAPRLLLFAGKGGVGKSTCAAAAAVVLAATRDVLLCGTDPAGALDEVFGASAADVAAALPRLRVVQLDAEAGFDELRRAYRAEIMDALEGIGLAAAAELDRRVIDALLDFAPPGIDELAAVAALLDAADADATVVIDAAPTGHFLRLLAMPALALDWTRQLMRLIVKYRLAGSADGAAEALLRTARELKSLEETLHDSAQSGVVVVTTNEPMVRAETERLLDTLEESGVHVAAIVQNFIRDAEHPDPRARREHVLIRAPHCRPPPIGATTLRDFAGRWKVVT